MNVSFSPAPDTRREKFDKALRPAHAAIFSRVDRYKECVAIVPHHETGADNFVWVWLNGEEGAFTDAKVRTREDCLKSLLTGQWVHQPDAQISMVQS